MIKEEDIMYENGSFWVLRCQNPKSKRYYYEVVRNTITHGEVCATIGEGESPNLGLVRAIAECDKRSLAAVSI